jgi:hypothetical protein
VVWYTTPWMLHTYILYISPHAMYRYTHRYQVQHLVYRYRHSVQLYIHRYTTRYTY